MKKAPRALLLVDWVPEKGSLLLESLRKNGLDCDIMGIHFHQSQWTPVKKILSHWPKCLWGSLKAFTFRNDYDYIIAWQQVMGMFLGLLKGLTFSQSPRIFILTAVIVERHNPILERMRRVFVALSLKRVNKIGYMSNGYKRLIRERFNLSEDQSVHLPFPLVFEKNPDFSGFKPDSYLYSVGLSYRDFATLMVAAKKSEKRFVVATTDTFFNNRDIPDNVTVFRNAFGKVADDLMERAAAVILPLERTSSPAAEATLISAMCYGKPVIITKTITTEEYITDGLDGLLVPWKDPDAILDAINFLFSNPEKAAEIGRRARQTVLATHAMERYSKKIVDIIQSDLRGNST